MPNAGRRFSTGTGRQVCDWGYLCCSPPLEFWNTRPSAVRFLAGACRLSRISRLERSPKVKL